MSELYGDFGGYDFLDNNCEHFAIWCATGLKTSNQVFFKNDDQDVISKTIDRLAEPGRQVCTMLDDVIDGTVKFFKSLFD
jgi:hypothetical protein